MIRLVLTVKNKKEGNEIFCGPWHEICSCNESEFEIDKQTIMERNSIDEKDINNIGYECK